jgi:hypothetical protein
MQLIAPAIVAANDTTIVENDPYTSPPVTLLQGTPLPTFVFGFNAPTTMTIDRNTGSVSWNQPAAGTYNIIIKAINEYATATASYKLTVVPSYDCTASTT